jgi:serine/threonine protein kinase
MVRAGEVAWNALVGREVAGCEVERVLVAKATSAVLAARTARRDGCVLKVVRSLEEESEARLRLLREARIASAIRHVGVVAPLAFGEDDALSLTYVVLPRYEATLAEALTESAPLDPDSATGLALQLAEGVAACHRARVVHRDLSPANTFVVGGERLIIGDFGIARALGLDRDLGATATGQFVGTLAYAAPEQVRSAKHVDERADVWSLGVMLYEMLTGAHPLGEVTPDRLLDSDVRARHLQDSAPWVEPRLVRLVHRMVERDRDRRFRDASEVVMALLRLRAEAPPRSIRILPLPCASRAHHAERATEIDAAGAVRRSSREEDLEDETIGGFELLRLIGRGATASVYEGRGRDGRHVAVKVLRRSWWMDQARSLSRLRREARALASLDHPNVVRLFEVGHDGDRDLVYAVMDLVRGTDLRTVFERHGPLEPGPLTRLFARAARGIAAAHACGIVPRDVKPANLLLALDDDGTVELKVADFGVAKLVNAADATSSQATGTGALVGSPAYMAPEQLRDAGHVDERADIWGLSVALYEGLAGERPWGKRQALTDLVLAINSDPIPPLRKRAPWVAPELADLVHRGLERELANRWASMSALAEALDELADAAEAPRSVVATELKPVTATTRAASSDAWSRERVSVPPRRRWLQRAGWLGVAIILTLMVETKTKRPEPARAGWGAALEGVSDVAGAASLPSPSPAPGDSASAAPTVVADDVEMPAIRPPAASIDPQRSRPVHATPVDAAVGEAPSASTQTNEADSSDMLRPPRSWP